MPDTAIDNSPELSVSELAGALKRTVEDRFGFVRVRGEVSNYRGPHSSGHAYFCLKDQTARIDAVIWKMTFQRLKLKPQEGLEVVVSGKITTYPGKSTYQIIIETLEPAGLGALMALLDERRRKLAAEGLFDQARKRPLPYLPARIGVITSPTGAVIRDILHRIAERFPRPVLVWPVRVQGETSAAEVAAAIAGMNALPATGPLARPDVLIVARGGGSLEDLWGFNEEIVARAAAASVIPLIAAIGHETDTTLIDLVADLRAPTPTGAAEKAVPVRAELLVSLADLGRRHLDAKYRRLERDRAALRGLARALRRPDDVLGGPRQRLDRGASRLAGVAAREHDRRHIALNRLGHRLAQQSPHAQLARIGQRLQGFDYAMRRARVTARERREQRLSTCAHRLPAAFQRGLVVERARTAESTRRLASLATRLPGAAMARIADKIFRLQATAQLLNSLGYRQVLARGFALVRDDAGHPRRSAAASSAGERLSIEFADGSVAATVTDVAAAVRNPAPKRPRRAGAAEPGQGQLF
jgi:exodeoxyribonuclease VII large subunit